MSMKERNQQIGERYARGDSVVDIAAAFNVSCGRVRTIVGVLGIERKPALPDRNSLIVALVEGGVKQAHIARDLGMSRQRVFAIVKREQGKAA